MVNKKNTGKIVLGVAAVVAAAMLYKKATGLTKSLEFLDFSLNSVKADFSKIFSPVLVIVANVSNPNAAPVPITGIFGKASYGTTPVATFQNNTPVEIGGRKTSTVTITAKLNSLGLVASLLSIIKNPNAKKAVNVDGMLQTGFFEQEFTQTINLQ